MNHLEAKGMGTDVLHYPMRTQNCEHIFGLLSMLEVILSSSSVKYRCVSVVNSCNDRWNKNGFILVLWWRWPHEGAGKGRKYEEPDLNNSEWWIPVHFWPALNIWGDDKLTTDDGFKNTVKLRILRCFLCALPLLWGTKNKGDFLLSVNGKKSVEHFFSVGSLHLETTLPLPLRAVLLTLRSCRKSDRSHVVRGKVRKRELYF